MVGVERDAFVDDDELHDVSQRHLEAVHALAVLVGAVRCPGVHVVAERSLKREARCDVNI